MNSFDSCEACGGAGQGLRPWTPERNPGGGEGGLFGGGGVVACAQGATQIPKPQGASRYSSLNSGTDRGFEPSTLNPKPLPPELKPLAVPDISGTRA